MELSKSVVDVVRVSPTDPQHRPFDPSKDNQILNSKMHLTSDDKTINFSTPRNRKVPERTPSHMGTPSWLLIPITITLVDTFLSGISLRTPSHECILQRVPGQWTVRTSCGWIRLMLDCGNKSGLGGLKDCFVGLKGGWLKRRRPQVVGCCSMLVFFLL